MMYSPSSPTGEAIIVGSKTLDRQQAVDLLSSEAMARAFRIERESK